MPRWYTDVKSRKAIVQAAREQRKHPTRSEQMLWQALRRKAIGVRVRRFHPIGYCVLDFFVASADLAIEVDGWVHDGREAADLQRQTLIESLGIRFIRFKAKDVEERLPWVVEQIKAAVETGPRRVRGGVMVEM